MIFRQTVQEILFSVTSACHWGLQSTFSVSPFPGMALTTVAFMKTLSSLSLTCCSAAFLRPLLGNFSARGQPFLLLFSTPSPLLTLPVVSYKTKCLLINKTPLLDMVAISPMYSLLSKHILSITRWFNVVENILIMKLKLLNSSFGCSTY